MEKAVGLVALSAALVVSSGFAVHTWEGVRNRRERTVQVTGSAKKRIHSDLATWHVTLRVRSTDATAAYKKLQAYEKTTLDYLRSQAVIDAELRPSSVTREEEFESVEEETKAGGRVTRQVFKGYLLTQSLQVRSVDVVKIERLSREVSSLLEAGVPVESGQPSYLYTKLGELKIEMLAEASRDARVRADKLVTAAGAAVLGRLRKADMGVININPADSTETSWSGNNDTTSVDKDIMTIVHCSFDLAE